MDSVPRIFEDNLTLFTTQIRPIRNYNQFASQTSFPVFYFVSFPSEDEFKFHTLSIELQNLTAP